MSDLFSIRLSQFLTIQKEKKIKLFKDAAKFPKNGSKFWKFSEKSKYESFESSAKVSDFSFSSLKPTFMLKSIFYEYLT